MSAAASATLADGGAQFGCSDATAATASSGRRPSARARVRSNSVTTRKGGSSRTAQDTPPATRAAATEASESPADTVVRGLKVHAPQRGVETFERSVAHGGSVVPALSQRGHVGGDGVGERGDGPAGIWKMATEGVGRHFPSTAVWEEEGVMPIVRGCSSTRLGPKVTVVAREAGARVRGLEVPGQ